MRKNKKVWSYALAAALAMSNLSVVAAPFSAIVAEAAASAMLVKKDDTEVDKANVDDVLTLSATTTGGNLVYFKKFESDSTWTKFNNTTSYKVVAEDAGKTIIFGAADSDKAEPDNGCTKTVAIAAAITHAYSMLVNGESSVTTVSKGKSYNLDFYDDTKDITSDTIITLKSGPASVSGKSFTVNDNAIENQKVVITVKYPGDETTEDKTFTVTKAASSTTVDLEPRLSSDSADLTIGGTTVDVLVDDNLPSDYTWNTPGEGNTNPTYAIPTVVHGDNIITATPTENVSNGFTLKVKDNVTLTQKATVTLRYNVSGNAKKTGDVEATSFAGYVDQTVTVYPAASYKLTIDGKDYDSATSNPYTLMEEDGSFTITAAVKPAGKDIPETDDVKFKWSTESEIVKVSPETGATVTISPNGTFKKSAGETVKLTVTKKDGTTKVAGIDTNTFDFTVKTDTTARPTITASATEVKPDDEVTFTVTGSDGKALTNFDLYDGGVDPTDLNKNKITDGSGKYKFAVGSHKVTVYDKDRQTESKAVTITSRSEDGVKATGLKIDKDSVEDEKGVFTEKVHVTVLPADADNMAEINTVTAKSSDEKIATVEVGDPQANVSELTITGVAPGETTIEITADDKNVKDKKVINVTVAGFKDIVITPDSGEVEVGKTLKLSADVQIYGKTASKDIVWHSSDESVATVKDGTVTGVAEGPVKIYATAKNDDSKKSNEVTITVADKTVENAVKAANDAADAAVANPTDATIKAAQDAVAAAKAAGAEEADLKAANEKIAKAEAAKKAADEEAKKKADEEAKKKAEEAAKAADDSAKGTPAPVGTELVDANGNKTGFKVTDANASAPEVEYEAPADKNATKADIPETYTDLSGNVYKVVGIDARAFKDTKVKTVTIRKNIKRIDPKAFEKSKVKNVKIKGTKLTKKMAKSFKKLKKGGKIKCSGSHKKKNKEILNNLSTVKNGKTKVK